MTDVNEIKAFLYDNTLKAVPALGLAMLKHAVLLVLYEAYISDVENLSDSSLRMWEMSEWLGIEKLEGDRVNPVHPILVRLQAEGCVEQVKRGRWQITEEGISVVESA